MSLFEPIEKEKKFSTVNVSRIICLTEANTETDEEKIIFIRGGKRARERKENIVKVFPDNQFNRFKCDTRSATRDSRYCDYLTEDLRWELSR